MTGRINGKIALVTGGAVGLGRAVCELFAAEGATVVVTDIDADGAARVAGELGGDNVHLHHDVASEQQWADVFEFINTKFGGLDILVNNAGIAISADPEETTLEQFRKTQAINTEGVFFGIRGAIPLMANSGGGSIVNLSSMASLMGYPPFFAYAASKGAVRAMTKSAAIHCQDKNNGIRCNSVHPAGIETPMIQKITGRVGVENEVPSGVLPAGSKGAPSDVANLILYLASDESRFITAGEFPVDNGLLYRPSK